MRIVGGKWKGRAIEAPDGKGTTRPRDLAVRLISWCKHL